ncbi:MAG: hypothetical protein Q9163_002381 [Psora crenata]
MLSGKVYVVTSPDLINAINRNSKKISFNPFIVQLAKRVTGHDEATGQIIKHNLNGENGPGYVIDLHDTVAASLTHGNDLEHMTRALLRKASSFFNALAEGAEINIFEWTRHMVTICSTRGIYGPENPFEKVPELVKAFWEYDNDMNFLIADVAPSIIAPKGYRARMKLARAFHEYLEDYNPAQSQSSAMVRARYNAAMRHGVTTENQGRLEVGSLIGILANTIPFIFYMLVRIYSDPQLVSDIREELETSGFLVPPDEMAQNPSIITIREDCPLLFSTFQEVLRLHMVGSNSRFVLEDVMLDETYLLRKGMVVQIPVGVLHNDVTAWGEHVKEFRPRRFLKQGRLDEGFKYNAASYRPFGGGASLCPGRHFLMLETLALMAVMLASFDLVPVNGQWSIPRQKQQQLATAVHPPAEDIRVRIRPRPATKA